jgi:hypothetical protein
MKRIVRLTESDLTRIVRRVIMEQASSTGVFSRKIDNQEIPFNKVGDKIVWKWNTMKFEFNCEVAKTNYAAATTRNGERENNPRGYFGQDYFNKMYTACGLQTPIIK